jgi:Cu2+-containing amine oxidase
MTAIKQTATVGQGGKIELQSMAFHEGATVEVIVLIEPVEQDTTAYLLSNPFNRERLLNSIANAEKHINLTYIDLDAEENRLRE